MIKFKIWDKKESINGVQAVSILDSRLELVDADVILIYDDANPNIITNIELASTLRSITNSKTDNAVEIANDYIVYLENTRLLAEQSKLTDEQRFSQLENTILQMQGVI